MKKEMKKKLLALGLSTAMFAGTTYALGGCQFPSTNPPDDQYEQEDPNKDPKPNPDPTPKPEPTPGKTLEEAKSELSAFIDTAAAGPNFTYTAQNSRGEQTVAEIAGEKVKLSENGELSYYTTENGKNFVYAMEDDGKYHINLTEETSKGIIEPFISGLRDVSWKEYDADTNTLKGTVNKTGNASVEARLEDGKLSFEVEMGNSTTSGQITKVNSTSVSLPNKANCIDDTVPKQEDKGDALFQVVNGKKVWNLPLLKQTIQNWFDETDYYKQQLGLGRMDASLDEIVYINTDDEVRFGAYVHVNGTEYFREFIFKNALESKFLNGELSTVKDFVDYLNQNKTSIPINTDGSSTEVEQSVSQADLQKMFANFKNRIAQIGVQKMSYDLPGEKTDQYNDYELTDAYKSFVEPIKALFPGADMGHVMPIVAHFFVVNENNQAKEITTTLYGATENLSGYYGKDAAIQNVISNNTNRGWLINAVIDDKDITLVPEVSKTRGASIDFYVDDRRK